MPPFVDKIANRRLSGDHKGAHQPLPLDNPFVRLRGRPPLVGTNQMSPRSLPSKKGREWIRAVDFDRLSTYASHCPSGENATCPTSSSLNRSLVLRGRSAFCRVAPSEAGRRIKTSMLRKIRTLVLRMVQPSLGSDSTSRKMRRYYRVVTTHLSSGVFD